jgi:hypothetical protein
MRIYNKNILQKLAVNKFPIASVDDVAERGVAWVGYPVFL